MPPFGHGATSAKLRSQHNLQSRLFRLLTPVYWQPDNATPGAEEATTLYWVRMDVNIPYGIDQDRFERLKNDEKVLAEDEPPPDWWTPLLSSERSEKVSNGPGTSSVYG
jgi:hypothetical protein